MRTFNTALNNFNRFDTLRMKAEDLHVKAMDAITDLETQVLDLSDLMRMLIEDYNSADGSAEALTAIIPDLKKIAGFMGQRLLVKHFAKPVPATKVRKAKRSGMKGGGR